MFVGRRRSITALLTKLLEHRQLHRKLGHPRETF